MGCGVVVGLEDSICRFYSGLRREIQDTDYKEFDTINQFFSVCYACREGITGQEQQSKGKTNTTYTPRRDGNGAGRGRGTAPRLCPIPEIVSPPRPRNTNQGIFLPRPRPRRSPEPRRGPRGEQSDAHRNTYITHN
jgi:hypothetical protein